MMFGKTVGDDREDDVLWYVPVSVRYGKKQNLKTSTSIVIDLLGTLKQRQTVNSVEPFRWKTQSPVVHVHVMRPMLENVYDRR